MKQLLTSQTLTPKWLVAPLTAALLSSFLIAPIAQARERGEHRAGNNERMNKVQARADKADRSEKKINRPHKPNNDKHDKRIDHIRDTSVNRVNIDKDVHVNANVNVNRHDHGGGWDHDHHHPLATALAVTATVAAIGSIVRTIPPNCAPYQYNGVIYQQCGNTWYQPQYMGTQVQYIVINRPY